MAVIEKPGAMGYNSSMDSMENMPLEILAPVGGPEQLLAAVRCGADAVYLGLSAFNARRNAENFDADALRRAASYCHARNVAVHVTLNTLVMDSEMEPLADTIRDIAAAGADAVIVQDLAVAALVRRICPTLSMHASTQMAVHNIDGVRMLESLGFSRAVLARELSLGEIAAIAANTPLEIEVFIHGALCMSVSGCCTLSSMLGGRSGNRGLCAQPCRLNFKSGPREYALSLKDLCGIPHLHALAQAGVRSVKIEGRMKRPEYVAAAVSACVAARRGEAPDLDSLRAVFSRSGFTDGYLTGRRTLAMFGNRTKEDVTAAAPVLKALSQQYRAERARVGVDMALDFSSPVPRLAVTDGARTVQVSAPEDVPAEPVPSKTAYERAERSLAKTGGTPFTLRQLRLDGAPASLPVSALNARRREALEALLEQREAAVPLPVTQAMPEQEAPHTPAAHTSLRLRFQHAEQLFCESQADRIILPVYALTPALVRRLGAKLIAELPRCAFPAEGERLERALGPLCEAGLTSVLAENLYGFSLAKRFGCSVHGGFGLNVVNSAALSAYAALGAADMTLSFELPLREIRRMGGALPRGIVAYGYLPLMYFRACPMQSAGGCGSCPGHGSLTDRRGVAFPVLCEGRRFSVLYNSVPLYLGGERLGGVDFSTLYFTRETREEAGRITSAYLAGEPLGTARTRGLYFRELL